MRLTHLHSGISVNAREERSRTMNKKQALARLAKIFAEQADDRKKNIRQDRWQQHNKLERGNPVRVFKGDKFREVSR